MTLADVLAAEQALVAAGKATACVQVCDATCHGALTCERASHPHSGDDWTPHLTTVAGVLVQWSHPEP